MRLAGTSLAANQARVQGKEGMPLAPSLAQIGGIHKQTLLHEPYLPTSMPAQRAHQQEEQIGWRQYVFKDFGLGVAAAAHMPA